VLYSSVLQSGRRLTDQAGTLYLFPLNVTVASVVVLVLVKKQLDEPFAAYTVAYKVEF